MKKITIFLILLLSPLINIFGQLQNIRIDKLARQPNEVCIAINLNNPSQLAVGSNLHYLFVSNNSGKDWDEKILTSSYGVWGDPCLIFDDKNSLYFAHLQGIESSDPRWLENIIVQKSGDLGKTFNDGTHSNIISTRDQDKEWMVYDNTNSPFKGSLYLTWTEFDSYGSGSSIQKSRILFSKSTDLGVTWSSPLSLSQEEGNCLDDDNTAEGAVPAVGPNGEIYVSWSLSYYIFFAKSVDGGKSFSINKTIAAQPGGWVYSIPGLQRCNGLPITCCDKSDNSINKGNIYVSWTDQRNGAGNTDVFFIKSADGGEKWTYPVKINDDTSLRDQFMNWMCVDEHNGDIYIVYYDRRDTQGNATNVYVARSKDGGTSWINKKVSLSSFIPSSSVFMGDYIGIAAYQGKIYPVWTRMDNGINSVMIAPLESSFFESVDIKENQYENQLKWQLFPNYPNPFNSGTNIDYVISRESHVKLEIVNILGEKISTLVNKIQTAGKYSIYFDGSRYKTGIYFCKLSADGITYINKMMMIK